MPNNHLNSSGDNSEKRPIAVARTRRSNANTSIAEGGGSSVEVPLTVDLASDLALDPRIVGGKAAALAKIANAQVRVPRGFVITSRAFQTVMAPISGAIISLLSDTSTSVADHEAAAADLRDLILSTPIPAALLSELDVSHTALGAGLLAVRSSSTAEDLEEWSFAGQYDSEIAVDGVDRLHAAIKSVWASLYSARAVAYRRERGVDESELTMAVLIQELVPADVSGVLFTRHPVSGDEAVHVITAAFGLGEGLVAGLVPSDSFTIDATTGATLEKSIAYKEFKISAGPAGQNRVHVDDRIAGLATLDEAQLSQLGQLGRSLRSLFGSHRDVEFAWTSNELIVLQARPITAVEEDDFHFEWDDPSDAAVTWGLRSKTPMLPLLQDLSHAVTEAARVGFDAPDSTSPAPWIFRVINGFSYQSSRDVPQIELTERRERFRELEADCARRGTSIYKERIEPLLLERLSRLSRPPQESTHELIARLDRAVEAYADASGHLHRVKGSVPSNDWAEIYANALGCEVVDAYILLQGLSNRTTRLIDHLCRLARIVQSSPTVADALARGDGWSDIAQFDPSDPGVKDFRDEFRRLISDYGRRTGIGGRGSVATLTSPTWSMNPDLPLGIIASYASQDLDDLDRRSAEVRLERSVAEAEVRDALSDQPELLARFELCLTQARNYTAMVEDHNHLMEQATDGALREVIDDVGRWLVRSGELDDPENVFALHLNEIRELRDGGTSGVRETVAARFAGHKRLARLRPPAVVGCIPSAKKDEPTRDGEPQAATPFDGSTIHGISASRGRYTGPAHIAALSKAPPAVTRGDVLIAKAISDAWTPIFPLLGGLVIETGNLFQHAAVIAREYRIPTVMMAHAATTRISSGQLITVDGTFGVVELDD